MTFDQETVERLKREQAEISNKHDELVLAVIRRGFENPRAQEFATQGFLRRLKTLVRCVDRVFEILPPDRAELPSNEELTDTAINIQAFNINVYGSTDNLAWIWVTETGLTQKDGTAIPEQWVGLRENNKLVRESLSKEFREYLSSLKKWFDNLENFRHALAHRISLYIPPYIVPDPKLPKYQELEVAMAQTRMDGDMEAYDRLSEEQKELAVFNPTMTHSFEEKAPHVAFHAQLLADYNTVVELGHRMLAELDR